MVNLPPPPPAVEARVAPAPAPAAMRGRLVFASVQLGAFPSRAIAGQMMRSFSARLTARIGQPPRVQAAMVDGRQWYRLVVGPFPASDARNLCRDLANAGTACLVRPEGDVAARPVVMAAGAPHRRSTTLARARIAPPRALSSESYGGN